MNRIQDFDFCVLGAGSAGYAAARTARDMGKSVAVVDSTGPLAGLCILRGCMPSKTLLRSAEFAHYMRTGAELGIRPSGVTYDVPAIVARKRRIIADFAQDRVRGIETFPLFLGAPEFASERELAVNGDVIQARKFLIATGSIINRPPLPGLADVGYLTSDDILDLEELPRSVIVLGGGPVACELAQYLARLGARTTMIQRSATLLSAEDADVGESLAESLQKDGISIHTKASVRRVERCAEGKRVVAAVSGAEIPFDAAEIFLALGRSPNVDGFELDAANVKYSVAGVEVDDHLQTSSPHVYAAGDVTGRWELVHVAVHQGELAAHNAFERSPESMDWDLQSARAVFTDPQVGIAGLTERQCEKRGIEFEKAVFPFADLGKAITADLTDGFVKMLATPGGRILGIAIVGAEASNLIHEAIALVYFKASVQDVLQMPHLHPTLAEIISYPAEELCERLKHHKHVLVTP
ncbi:MAG: dihydrolipoyl dehydrogenase [Candidatus Eremiobacter antarcticus]|nr:FAD-dependent oxidoreductase [Candidatus Eremiobacteraeota bacterium]MBC5808960.1 FAD-dependent oxidoreductase [Candidatus Eremiobacteraeota bacterium]PZR60360.1 MAG: dihydrolipoyl dehydrogenase [Candidatus Eremiobacter sp. RRmetagenome_bin22]